MFPSTSIKKVFGVAVVTAVLLMLAGVGSASAAAADCQQGSVLYSAAHEDDTLLFQSPAILRDIRSERCVGTIFTTAGDAGRPETYWVGREEGAEAAYASMANVANEWEASTLMAAGHAVRLMTLKPDPRVTIVFLRLPDGSVEGEGWEMYGFQSLMKLWKGTIGSMTTVDGTQTYTSEELVKTLGALINHYEPSQIATQNFEIKFFEGDHQDHVATGYFVRAAALEYTKPHRLLAYVGYPSSDEPANITGELLGYKSLRFYAYGSHDSDACTSKTSCESTPYELWLERQYVAGTQTVGVVAYAGFLQTTSPETAVVLNGEESSTAGSGPLHYRWKQVGGPGVTLTGTETATPSFVTPSHPTLLTFSLVVSEGLTESAPSFVKVRLPSGTPNPTAVVGPGQIVSTHASVTLEGSESWDPNALPLTYEWQQAGVSGEPPVVLTGATSAKPSFTAPIGPATLSFKLVVSNGTQSSTAASVIVKVRGVAPKFTSPAAASFTAGTDSSFTVVTTGSPAPGISLLSGSLPAGLAFEDQGDGTATISGVAAGTGIEPGTSHVYAVELGAENEIFESEKATSTQGFSITVAVPALPPTPPTPTPPVEKTPDPPVTTTVAPTLPSLGTRYVFSGASLKLPIQAGGAPSPTIGLAGSVPGGVRLNQDGGGAATLTGKFSGAGKKKVTVVAGNAAGEARSTLTVVVVAPPRLSSSRIQLPAGSPVKGTVGIVSGVSFSASCKGPLPAGARCVVSGRTIVVRSSRPLSAGAHRLTVTIKTRAGTVRRSLVVKVVRPDTAH